MAAKGEDAVGMKGFLTDTDGMGGRLRKEPEDFRVKEISLPTARADGGEWTLAVVTSRNWETNRLVKMMARRLHMGRERIRFAGTKDKRAVTTQLMAFKAPVDKVTGLRLKDVTVEDAYPTDRPIDLGDLIGNEFEIKVTEVEDADGDLMDTVRDTATQVKDNEGFPNFFGIQRFGVLRPVTHIVGRHMVRGEFKEAVMIYLGEHCENESEEVQEARRGLRETGDLRRALRELPKQFSFERSILQHLLERKGDWTGALRRLPKNLLWMFVHAYQSYLFNLMLSERMRRELPLNTPIPGDLVLAADKDQLPDHDKWVPVDKDNMAKVTRQVKNGWAFVSGLVIGSGTEFAKGAQGEIERAVIKAEGLKGTDFIVPEMPEVTSKGIRRELVSPVYNLRYHKVDDDVLFTFKLNRGCYATCLMREFMKAEDTLAY